MIHKVHTVLKLGSETQTNVVLYKQLVHEVCADLGIPVVGFDSLDEYTLIVAIGGDGTMLQGMRLSANHHSPVIGINLGKVGFLTDISPSSSPERTLREVLTAPSLNIESRLVLGQTLSKQTACNEVSISRSIPDAILTYELEIGGLKAGTHRANSILIATATGSTAYSLSAGGAIMTPTVDCLQIVPVAPVSLTSRPIIADPSESVTIRVIDSRGVVKVDGQIVGETNEVHIFADSHARVVRLPNWSFFDNLTHKLGWKAT